MAKSPYSAWFSAGLDAWALGMEASAVIALRTTRIAMGGDPSGRETRLMVSEKVKAAMELQTALLTGSLGASPGAITTSVLRSYTRKVRANRKRLS